MLKETYRNDATSPVRFLEWYYYFTEGKTLISSYQVSKEASTSRNTKTVKKKQKKKHEVEYRRIKDWISESFVMKWTFWLSYVKPFLRFGNKASDTRTEWVSNDQGYWFASVCINQCRLWEYHDKIQIICIWLQFWN